MVCEKQKTYFFILFICYLNPQSWIAQIKLLNSLSSFDMFGFTLNVLKKTFFLKLLCK